MNQVMEQKIIFWLRNYECTDKSLANEISKEFGITFEQAVIEICNIRKRFSNFITKNMS